MTTLVAAAPLRRLWSDSLLRNSAHLISTTLVNSGLGYVYWLVAARAYSAEQIGIATSLVAAMTFISTLADLGLRTALIAALPATRSREEWSRVLSSVAATVAVTALVAGDIGLLVLPHVSAQLDLVRGSAAFAELFVAGVVAWNLTQVVDSTFVAERCAGGALARNTTFGVVKLAALFVPLVFGLTRDARSIFATWVIGAAVSAIVLALWQFPRLDRGAGIRLDGATRVVRGLAATSFGHHLTNIGAFLPMYVLPLEVIARVDARDAGYFYLTWMLGGLFFTISPSICSALFAENSHDLAGVRAATRRSARLITVLLTPAMVGFVVFGDLVLRLFGASYARHGYLLLVLLVVSAIPDAVTNLYVGLLRVTGGLREAAALNVFMGVLAVALAWPLLPRLGIVGAGWAWLAAQSAGAVWVGVRAPGRRPRPPAVGTGPAPSPLPGPLPAPNPALLPVGGLTFEPAPQEAR